MAVLSRAKRMPTLESLLKKVDHAGPPTDEDIQATQRAMEEGAALLKAARQRNRKPK